MAIAYRVTNRVIVEPHPKVLHKAIEVEPRQLTDGDDGGKRNHGFAVETIGDGREAVGERLLRPSHGSRVDAAGRCPLDLSRARSSPAPSNSRRVLFGEGDLVARVGLLACARDLLDASQDVVERARDIGIDLHQTADGPVRFNNRLPPSASKGEALGAERAGSGKRPAKNDPQALVAAPFKPGRQQLWRQERLH